MLISSNATWRKRYYTKVLHVMRSISQTSLQKMPETLEFPTSDKLCMFELGGSKHTSGSTILVATPSGFPNAAVVLSHRKANGLHVCSKVWPGCLVSVATHQFGQINIGVYKIAQITKAKVGAEDEYGTALATLVVGCVKVNSEDALSTDWYKQYEHQYPGIRRLIKATVEKLVMYQCTTPIYTEPFTILRRYTGKDPDFAKLLLRTDLPTPEHVSHLTPQYAIISNAMKGELEYTAYSVFEQAIIKACKELEALHPYVYVYLCHHPKMIDDVEELVTQAFIAYQHKETDILSFVRTSYLYKHFGYEKQRSYDLESYIRTKYNPNYMAMILGVDGGIRNLIRDIELSKDRCVSVPLKYALCTKKYVVR